MKWFRLMCLVAVAFHLAGSGIAADHAAANTGQRQRTEAAARSATVRTAR